MFKVSSGATCVCYFCVQIKVSIPPSSGLMPSVTWSTMICIKIALTSTHDFLPLIRFGDLIVSSTSHIVPLVAPYASSSCWGSNRHPRNITTKCY